MGDDNTTTVLPANGTPGFFHSGGNNSNYCGDNLLSQLVLSNNLADDSRATLQANWQNHAFLSQSLERNSNHTRDDLKEIARQNADNAATFRKEMASEIASVKLMLLEKSNNTEIVLRQIETDRLKAELADAKTKIIALSA